MSRKVVDFILKNYVSKGQISINGTVYHNIPYEVTDEFGRIVNENQQLKEVIEEVKEYLNNENYKDENFCIVNGVEILQILEKVKDVK